MRVSGDEELKRARNQEFEGVMVPLLLPLDENERVIEGDLREHVRYLLGHGVDGFLVPSGTGEFYNLSSDERRRSVEIVVSEAKDDTLVVSLTGGCSTRRVLKLIAAAREAGADGAMATPPYFSAVSQPVLKRFFNTLADNGKLPFWLYHQPTHTKVVIEPETVAELAENPDIMGIKASAWVDILYFHRLVRAMADMPSFRILMGEDMNHLSGLVIGGHGMVATLANLMPEAFVGLWKAIRDDNVAEARKLQDRIMDVEEPLIHGLECWRPACKLILKKRGLFSTTICSEPSPLLSAADHKKVEALGEELRLF